MTEKFLALFFFLNLRVDLGLLKKSWFIKYLKKMESKIFVLTLFFAEKQGSVFLEFCSEITSSYL